MKLNSDVINQAYLYLKSYVYHDNLNLFLKQRLAEFELNSLDRNIETLAEMLTSDDPLQEDQFKKWLQSISYNLLPKSIVRPEDEAQKTHNKNNGLYISNVTLSPEYQVSKVNYFINAPIELHLIEVLWCLIVAPLIEENLTEDCYGNRMGSAAKQFIENNTTNSNELFKRYVEQYNLWRDQAIETATELANKDEDVALLSLDLKSYYYHIDIDFDEIRQLVTKGYNKNKELQKTAIMLTDALHQIYDTYHHKISSRINTTHNECKDKLGLPIGFASSSILANWYLTNFDNEISDEVRPSYYGRYVDDILLVFKRPKIEDDNPIQGFIDKYLQGLLKKESTSNNYYINVQGNELPIQRDKLILQFFDKNHSRAGLEVFKQELEERSSAFKFLPGDHIDKDLEKFAYDVLYDGSANKLRSVVGLAENETELSKYLSSHIMVHRLCNLNKKETVLPQLDLFFSGSNTLQFSRLWEKVYQYAIIFGDHKFITDFFNSLNSEINKLVGISTKTTKKHRRLTSKIKSDLKLYNKLALSLSVGLLDIVSTKAPPTIKSMVIKPKKYFHDSKKEILTSLVRMENLQELSFSFRKSNLIRHHLVAWPMANFTDFEGDLTDEQLFINSTNCSANENKIKLSPRFIHFDEWQAFDLLKTLQSNTEDENMPFSEWLKDSISEYESRNCGCDFPVQYKTDKEFSSISKMSLVVGEKTEISTLKIALANLNIQESDISDAIRKDKKPNVSFERQKNVYKILNVAVEENADILIMPEVSIPVSWLPFMIAHARRHQLGMIFGLEHWVVNGQVYNLIIEALPFKVSGNYKSCVMTARLKNHYAPDELDIIESLRLKPANKNPKHKNTYHKVSWRGVSFATYNCFELSDIKHRTLFKSDIDLLFACVWNKDTNYYQHILESSVRDLHCYVVQSNTSQFGGSCVLRPTKKESKTMLYVKGGNNACVLTTDINIKALRDFQYPSKSNSGEFKHLPPGFDCVKVLTR